jgi:hypothetical protein
MESNHRPARENRPEKASLWDPSWSFAVKDPLLVTTALQEPQLCGAALLVS